MPVLREILRLIARVVFHAAFALVIVLLTLHFLFPDILLAAANNFPLPLTDRLPHMEMDAVVNVITGIIATVWSTCRGVGHSLGSTGAALVHSLQQSSWTDLMERAQTKWQWVKGWLSVLKGIISTAWESDAGRLVLLIAAINLANNLLALVRMVAILMGIAARVMYFIYKIMTNMVHLFARMVMFPYRLLGTVATLIGSLF